MSNSGARHPNSVPLEAVARAAERLQFFAAYPRLGAVAGERNNVVEREVACRAAVDAAVAVAAVHPVALRPADRQPCLLRRAEIADVLAPDLALGAA